MSTRRIGYICTFLIISGLFGSNAFSATWECPSAGEGKKNVLFATTYDPSGLDSAGHPKYALTYCIEVEKNATSVTYNQLLEHKIVRTGNEDNDANIQYNCLNKGSLYAVEQYSTDKRQDSLQYSFLKEEEGVNCGYGFENKTVKLRFRIQEKSTGLIDNDLFLYYIDTFDSIGGSVKGLFCGCSYQEPAPTCATSASYYSSFEFGKQEVEKHGQNQIDVTISTEEECSEMKNILQTTFNTCSLPVCTVSKCDMKNGACVAKGICECRTGSAAALTTIPELKDKISCEQASAGTSIGGLDVEDCIWNTTGDVTKDETEPATKPTNVSIPVSAGVNTDEYKKPPGYDGPLPDCAFDGSCRDVNDLLAVAIKIGELALGFVGSLALVFFVYGGFTMILSMGNAEKVKKGREILIASVIGIVIAFSAYAIVNFTLDVLQVQSGEFRVIK